MRMGGSVAHGYEKSVTKTRLKTFLKRVIVREEMGKG